MTIHIPGLQPGWKPSDLERVIRQLMAGKMNAVTSLTLTANAASTTFADPRITAQSVILMMPTTANASAEIGAGTIYIGTRTTGSATVTHANNANADRTFAVAIIG